MLESITFFKFLGMPLIIWGGIFTFLCFLFTASIAVMNKRGIHTIPFKWHPRMAIFSILFGLVHGILGILTLF
jgi:hypothetical protein